MARRARLSRLIALGLVLAIVTCAFAWRWWSRGPLREAQRAYNVSRWWEALALCRSYLERNPRDGEALRIGGQSAARVGLYEEADRLLTQAGGLLPNELRTHGEVLLKLRDWDRANVILETLAHDNPDDLAARMTLTALSVQRGRYNQAVDYASKALSLAAGTPQESHCEYLLGSAYFARGDISEAATHYIRALDVQGSGPAQLPLSTIDLRLEIIDHLLSVSRLEEAREQLAMLPTEDPVPVEQLYQLGRLCMLTNNLAGAQAAWEQVLSRSPDHFGALVQLGKQLLDLGHVEQALNQLQHAVQVGQDSAQAHFLLYQAYEQIGDRERAEQETKRFRELNALDEQERQEILQIRRSPDHRDSQWLLAKRAMKVGDIHSARIFLNHALRIDPDFEPAREALAKIELQRDGK
jgi:tetratricopeptide (TPR) repeat protein